MQMFELSALSKMRIRCASIEPTIRNRPRIVTHDGIFHCDEVFGSWLLTKTKKFRNAEVVRTRNPAVIEEADVVIDVGGIYDPDAFRFDHHDIGFQEYFTESKKHCILIRCHPTFDADGRVKLSSAGLIYRHFGKEVLRKIIQPMEISESELISLYYRLYHHVVEAIDGVDNGMSTCRSSEANYMDKTNLIARVGMLNVSWQDYSTGNDNDNAELQDQRFGEAMELCGRDFTAIAQSVARNWLPARKYVKKAIEERFSLSSTGRIIFMNVGCPWKDHLIHLEREMNIEDEIFFCVHQGESSVFYVQAVPDGISTFRTRLDLPSQWRGHEGENLDDIVGTRGCVFAHIQGYIGGHHTKAGAIEMAEKAILFG